MGGERMNLRCFLIGHKNMMVAQKHKGTDNTLGWICLRCHSCVENFEIKVVE